MKVHDLFAYLRVKDAGAAIDFCKAAFGATEKFRLTEPSGRIGHAELDFSGTTLLSEEYPEYGILGPQSVGGTGGTLHLHVDDADALNRRAVQAGATLLREPTDPFHGERSGTVRDPFGQEWLVGHSIEQVTPEEMQRRSTAMPSGADGKRSA